MTLTAIPQHSRPLTELDEAWRAASAGARFEAIRAAAPRLRERIAQSGVTRCVRTFDNSAAPYPTRFAFGGAASLPLPYIVFMNRMNVVEFEIDGGDTKTLLFNPTDAERSAETPFFANMRKRMGDFVSTRVATALKKPKPVERLAALGLRPEDVDYIAFDHMHTQDVRAMLGTSGDGAAAGLHAEFPNAKLLIWRPELDIFHALHPLQEYWYVRDGVRGVPTDRFIVCDRDLLLGKGVALVRTPGHTVGNWSLVLHTDSGIWAISENGICCDNYAPEASRIPGLRRYAREHGVEAVLNSNTLEGRNEQYTSMMLEKALVDRCRDNADFYQHFSSSELIPTPIAPGLSPTYRHGGITSGEPVARRATRPDDRRQPAAAAGAPAR